MNENRKSREIGIVLGSTSDIDKVSSLFSVLDEFEVPYEVAIISAHRTPHLLREYAKDAPSRGVKVIIAAAGLSAALPGALAAEVDLPVIGLPISTPPLNGVEALLAMAQMPPGVPVASVGIDSGKNAALLALRILALYRPELYERLAGYRENLARDVLEKAGLLRDKGLPVWVPEKEET
ncbi:MAG: 5-(carboxyamino)imidazole ribonucleotide mutase [Candidatus Fermentithermobacillus carboniphilus]|uniref:N5-carboxyaminoimidazole ribonucleotide mutase n=1 Tax=Candidatus Fermentithermobacillus carboniphilus TaxID=3085328 RepID=A0AAT9LAI9_9FIRM|nr:MAG: 5-(carboxyamino)imidazole ribonucleotide mutase [Candidatus Fermentithermobacillus carboniphilus]